MKFYADINIKSRIAGFHQADNLLHKETIPVSLSIPKRIGL